MDLTNIRAEDIKEMSKEELTSTIRELIHADSNEESSVKTTMLDGNGNAISVSSLIEKFGSEDAVVEMIVEGLLSDKVRCHSIPKEQFDEVINKAISGEELSDTEKALIEVISSDIPSDHICFQTHCMAVLLKVLDFSQKQVGYNASLSDVAILFHILTVETMRTTPELQDGMTKSRDTTTLMSMAHVIAEDIMTTWRASLKNEPSKGMVILALATALLNEIFIYENDNERSLELPPADYLLKTIGICPDDKEEESHDCNCDCGNDERHCKCDDEEYHYHDKAENGSNEDSDSTQ